MNQLYKKNNQATMKKESQKMLFNFIPHSSYFLLLLSFFVSHFSSAQVLELEKISTTSDQSITSAAHVKNQYIIQFDKKFLENFLSENDFEKKNYEKKF